MKDERRTKKQLVEELDGLRGEAVVEQALERVRLPALRMQEITDLDHVFRTLLIELTGLDLPIHNSTIAIFDEASNRVRISIQRVELDVIWAGSEAPLTEFVSVVQFDMDAWCEGRTQWRRRDIKSEEWTPWVSWWIARAAEHSPDYSYDGKDHMRTCEHAVPFSSGALILHSPERIPDESLAVVRRFADVFDFAYSRFLELKQKEDQNRELTIQNALERVRARALGMQTSDELDDVSVELFAALHDLGIEKRVSFIAVVDEEADEWRISIQVEGVKNLASATVKLSEVVAGGKDTGGHIVEAWRRGDPHSIQEFRDESVRAHFDFWADAIRQANPGYVRPEEYDRAEQFLVLHSNNRYGSAGFGRFSTIADEETEVVRRFSQVFELAYSRFLELKEKEQRARDAQIEAALERVRAQALSMQISDDLPAASAAMFRELRPLYPDTHVSVIGTLDVESQRVKQWTVVADKQSSESYIGTKDYDGIRVAPEQFDLSALLEAHPYTTELFSSMPTETTVYLSRLVTTAEQHRAIDRLVESGQWTARQGEERVRSRAQGMRSSDDIGEVTTQLFREFHDLGIPLRRSGIMVLDVDSGKGETWFTEPSGAIRKGEPFDTSVMDEHPDLARIYKAFRHGEPYVHTELSLAETVELVFFHRDHLHMALEYADEEPAVITDMLSAIYPDGRVHNYGMMFPQGMIIMVRIDTLSEEELDIAQRFAGVFGFAFTRMLEITKAEQEARQAERRAAVDQVRAEIAVMHMSADLERVITPLIWRKLTEAGVPFLRSGVFIFDEESRQVHAFLVTPDGKPLAEITLPFDNPAPALSFVTDVVEHWRARRFYTQSWDRQTFTETMRAMIEQDPTLDPERYLDAKEPPESLELHMAPFAQGMLYVGSEEPLASDDIRLTEELAAAFSVAYARFQDFQRLEKQNRALETANTQVEEANRLKSVFLASMSHDLRTPMNAIIGYTRILLRRAKDALDDRQYLNLENIQTSASNLLILINDILDLSKIEAGRIDITPEDVDLRQLVSDCVTSVLVKPDVRLEERIEEIDSVHTDVDLIRKVVMNVMGNAAKFTERGSITVSVKPVNEWIELSVADTGSGIPADDLPHIFDEFRQVDREGGQEGTGLGLSIAKKSIELLGGSISAESEVGAGTTFTLRIRDYQPETG